jgi:hypothetical protein
MGILFNAGIQYQKSIAKCFAGVLQWPAARR